MTSREVMMRTVEALAQMGVREPARLMKDAAIVHDYIMKCDDVEPQTEPEESEPAPAKRRTKAGQAD